MTLAGYPAEVATASLAQLALFAMISSFVFNYGATIAEERSRSTHAAALGGQPAAGARGCRRS